MPPRLAATLTVAVPIPDVAPEITRLADILPGTAELDDVVTLDLGAARGTPEPAAEWDFTRDGVSIKGSVDVEAMTVVLAAPGDYRLTVGWRNRAGLASAMPVELTIADPGEVTPPAVAPAVTRQPAISPATAKIGDRITLDLGTASGTPVFSASASVSNPAHASGSGSRCASPTAQAISGSEPFPRPAAIISAL